MFTKSLLGYMKQSTESVVLLTIIHDDVLNRLNSSITNTERPVLRQSIDLQYQGVK